MTYWLIIIAANLGVGALVGLTGVAGFLLPMLYAGGMGMSVTEGLALSFAAFVVSGTLGSLNYHKAGNLDLPFGIRLSMGSFVGAVLGVRLNLIIPEEKVKLLLYLVVLLSGISILLRKEKVQEKGGAKGYQISEHMGITLVLGFVTGVICALSGAGGPVLVMPLLVLLGISVRTAVGVALFNSIFIGIPACAGYLMQCDIKALLPSLGAALAAHGVGVYFGSVNAVHINQKLLKKGIAIFSILIAVWKLWEIISN